MKEYSLKQLDRIYKRAIKHGYDGTYGDFISDFGNVPEDFLELSKKKSKTTKVATAKHGGMVNSRSIAKKYFKGGLV